MLIICHIDWRKVGVAFELQCLRNCTLSSLLLFCSLIVTLLDISYLVKKDFQCTLLRSDICSLWDRHSVVCNTSICSSSAEISDSDLVSYISLAIIRPIDNCAHICKVLGDSLIETWFATEANRKLCYRKQTVRMLRRFSDGPRCHGNGWFTLCTKFTFKGTSPTNHLCTVR